MRSSATHAFAADQTTIARGASPGSDTRPRAPALRRALGATVGGMTTLIAAACLLAAAGNARADTLRSFWDAPSLDALATHTMRVHERRHGEAADPATVADDEARIARMKAWLAKGVVGAPPEPPAAWDALEAAAHRIASAGDARDASLQPAVHGLQGALGLYPGAGWLEPDDPQAAARLAALVRSIELPAVGESWFADVREVTLDDQPTEALSGRFGIVHTVRAIAGPHGHAAVEPAIHGERFRLALTQPLVRSTIHVDGRIDETPTRAATQRAPWGDDADPCAGFVPGYRLGDADAGYWSALGLDAYARSQEAGMKPVGSVVAIVTRDGLPLPAATVQGSRHAIDARTGFVEARQLRFDVDDDGITDLLMWEGRGDDTTLAGNAGQPLRHRLFFVNVLGQWHLLGHDAPVASCHGC
jgi:hypothetical protein